MTPKPWLAAERIGFDPPRQREFTVTNSSGFDESQATFQVRSIHDIPNFRRKPAMFGGISPRLLSGPD